MTFARRTLVLASVLVGASVSVVSTPAQACDYIPGIFGTAPRAGETLAANDSVVLSFVGAGVSQYTWQVQVDGVDVDYTFTPVTDGLNVFLDTEYVALSLAAPPPEGSTLSISGTEGEALDDFSASYTVGPADTTALVDTMPDVSLSLAFEAVSGDSCNLPDHYVAGASFERPGPLEDGQRSRFFTFTAYPADGSPADALGRSFRLADDEPPADLHADFAADGVDLSSLCMQVAVTDMLGASQVLHEDCDLCGSFPELCEDEPGDTDGETDGSSAGGEGSASGCSVGGGTPLGAAGLLLLGLVGFRRRRS